MRKKVIAIFYLSVLSALSAKSAVQTINRYATRLADAKQSNNAITGGENYIQNEKWENALLLKTLEYGRDTLSLEEISQLETLAKSCPSIEGLAVYKARVLYSYFEPALDYNDYTICNPQNKYGSSLFGDLLQFLSNPKAPQSETNRGTLQQDDYKIYPVPSSETITIQYDFAGNEDATMNLYDILGREIETIQLSNTNTLVSFSVLTIPNGVYTYKIKVGKETKTGKIQILK